jgi:hypothetical protein
MKSVFYIITLNKIRYVACIELNTCEVITTQGGWFQKIRNNQIVKQAYTIKELL